MRFILRLASANGKPSNVRIDYRSRFISLLKKVFGEEEFSKKAPRSYTFAVYFGKEAKVKKTTIEGVKLVNFRFSTGDSIVAVKFYNGILRLKKEGYTHKIGTGEFRIEWIKEEKEKPITGIFKTLSPVIVERIGFNNSKNPTDRYVIPSEERFTESLLENILRRYRSITGKDLSVESFSFEDLGTKKEFIRHYGGLLKGFLGRFRIRTDSEELLEFVYRYGLGLRTGQGFGYLEVEKDGNIKV